ncbi:hypothetical protein ONS95_009486 [Cadophora gregata]|uniref:uncharacterized protein n=1 Tax=Cadophora gregata TaxID=51156 RepID=UPI0026DCEA06|nr:uncharacterized protein ONS95_009486 [Cadophora gregata]KAK0124538.1 hypothetical protein ONS95_009486 [Cadophora gregata]KAK0129611.1 hypothetical protein ONS96_000175 [Cadophora gregata f. sp. sojae]
MAQIVLPFEVKRLICDHVDLPTIKSLRLVSHSWAAVGMELLFLPTFTIKSSAIDISCLIRIGSCPGVARQAAKTIRTLSIWSNDWDVICLRSIVCSRHVHLSNYEVLDFVPDQDESEALDELDALIEQRKLDERQGESVALLTQALKQVPRLQKLQITCPNPFKHPMLRKVWEEYDLETYRHPSFKAGPLRLLNIFAAAKKAGLDIMHFQHEQFNSNYFSGENNTNLVPWDFSHHTPALRSLDIVINDLQSNFFVLTIALNKKSHNYHDPLISSLISLPPTLQSLSIRYESIDRLPTSLLTSSTPSLTLHSLSLTGIILSPTPFLTLLSTYTPSLQQLNLTSIELHPSITTDDPTYDWKTFLSHLRDTLGTQLQKFQFAGVIKAPLPNGAIWMFWPIYRTDGEGRDWEELPPPVKPTRHPNARERTREMERFVIGGGEWPMKAEDDISNFVT